MPLQDKILDAKLLAVETINSKISKVSGAMTIKSVNQKAAERLTGGTAGLQKVTKYKAQKTMIDKISEAAANGYRYATTTCSAKVAPAVREYFSKNNYIVIQLVTPTSSQNYVAWYGKSYCRITYGNTDENAMKQLINDILNEVSMLFNVNSNDRREQATLDKALLIVTLGKKEYAFTNGGEMLRYFNELMEISTISDKKKQKERLNKLNSINSSDVSIKRISEFLKLYTYLSKLIRSTK